MTNNEQILMEAKERATSNTHRIDKIEERLDKVEEKTDDIHTLAGSIDKMAQSFDYMRKDINNIADSQKELKQNQEDMKVDIVELKNAPSVEKSKLFDKVTGVIITLVATGITAFILGQVCPTIFG